MKVVDNRNETAKIVSKGDILKVTDKYKNVLYCIVVCVEGKFVPIALDDGQFYTHPKDTGIDVLKDVAALGRSVEVISRDRCTLTIQ